MRMGQGHLLPSWLLPGTLALKIPSALILGQTSDSTPPHWLGPFQDFCSLSKGKGHQRHLIPSTVT